MSQGAKVTSIDAVREFQGAMGAFCEDAREALCSAEMEARRLIDWIAHDRLDYWKRAIRDRQEEVSQAKNDLYRKQLEGMNSDYKPDVTEQKKALRIALMRVEEAEQKYENCRKWSRALEQPFEEYKGFATQLSFLIEGEPPRPVGLLERIIASLDSYVELAVPVSTPAPVGSRPETPPPAEGSSS